MKKITAYESKNGLFFKNPENCAKEDGLVKCKNCDHDGQETYDKIIPYPSGLPDSGWVEDKVLESKRTCSVCDGLGYVEPLEQDDEYKEYLRLKEKFGDEND